MERLRARTIELLHYPGEHTANLGWHQDTQSAVTVLLMVSPIEDYEGGRLQHRVAGAGEGGGKAASLQRGDVAVYRSHQIHRVTDTTKGLRVSMAIEFWHVDHDDVMLTNSPGDGRPTYRDTAAPFHDACPR